MPAYYLDEAVFVLPDRAFVDRTLHRLESPLAGEDPLRIEVRRLAMEPGRSLRQLVEEEVAASKVKVNGFTLVDEAEVNLDGAPAIVLHARLRARDLVYHQRQAHVALGQTWIALVVTAPSADRAACDETFDRIMRSFEWRSG